MSSYKVITKTLSFNKPGLNPTTKNGTDMGWVLPGFTFTPGSYENGWLAILPNKWIKALDCQEITIVPPPPDSEPVSNVVQIRFGTKQGDVITWQAPRQFEEC